MKPNVSLQQDIESEIRQAIDRSLRSHGIAILPPMDVKDSLQLMKRIGISPSVTMLDPWYNKGVGGVRDDYREFIIDLLRNAVGVSDHVFLWGFPEIVAYFVDKLPEQLNLVAWLTWYYKNNPSVIRGWRSSQNACLHLAGVGAKLYPEHFLNEAQKAKQVQGKLRYMPGPTSVIEEDLLDPPDVIEASLMVGFVGRKEQTGHPSQKPVSVFEKLYLMTTTEGDLIFDPMSGSGTTGEAARRNKRLAIISDHSDEYTKIAEDRLGIERIPVPLPMLPEH
ncbi:MAG: site-specific DNA-methyltransferase [Blastocatellia bacterium]|nr:site-specific DNA-methyltransferase [Blastocatellia bacterium]